MAPAIQKRPECQAVLVEFPPHPFFLAGLTFNSNYQVLPFQST